MKFPVAKLLATAVCSVSLLGAATAPAEACFFNWLFGPCCGSSCSPCGSPCATYYGPACAGGCSTGACSSGTCGTTAYYAPFGWGSPAYADCSTCSTGCSSCGTTGGSCASGDCGVNTQWNSKDSKKDPNDVRTYGEPGQDSGEPKRTGSESGLGSSTRRVPPSRNGSGIEQTGAEKSNLREAVPVNPRPGTKAAPALPAAPEDEENGSGVVPVLKLDDKVASRAAPERRRIALPPQVANARLIRVPAYPKSDWVAADEEAKVAKK